MQQYSGSLPDIAFATAGPAASYTPASGDAEVPDFEPDFKRQRSSQLTRVMALAGS